MRGQGSKSESPRLAFLPWLVVGVVAAALLVWRLRLLSAGPDPDSDAYGHHMIARQILADPTDLSVHWVWLPLFHYAQALLVAFGGTLQTVRVINAIAWTALPFVVLRFVGANKPEALIAALLCALNAIGMQMGTTGQPEPFFCLFVLGFVVAMTKRRFAPAAILLSAAVMFRYEAWAVMAAAGALLAYDRLPHRRSHPDAYPWRAWIVIAMPFVAIAVWAILRRPFDGEWFGFLRQTKSFANDATGTRSSLDRGVSQLALDLVYYAVRIPFRTMGVALLLAPFGVVRAARTHGRFFILSYLACLGFLTLTWVMRSSLGLDRHFVVLVPFYAILVGHGAAQVGEIVARASDGARPYVNAALGCVALLGTWLVLDDWMHQWRGALEHGWPDRVAVGAYLRTIPPRDVIYCDEATVEILSGVDRKRFDRHWMDAPDGPDRAMDAAAKNGEVYVATWARKLKDLRNRPGVELVFRPRREDGAEETSDDAGLLVLRVRRAPSDGITGRAQR